MAATQVHDWQMQGFQADKFFWISYMHLRSMNLLGTFCTAIEQQSLHQGQAAAILRTWCSFI